METDKIQTLNFVVEKSGKLVEVPPPPPTLPEVIIDEVIIDLNDEIDPEIRVNIKNYDTLVLSGGSVKSIVTLGAVQYAYEKSYLKDIKSYIGTSAGSMICYLLAIGYTPLEIFVHICTTNTLEKMKHFDIVSMINGMGATSFTHLNEFLELLTIDKLGYYVTLQKLYENTGNDLTCVTYNDTKCCIEYLNKDTYPDLPCLTAIRMSSNLPLIFSPVKYMGNFYNDGGLGDNFPILYGETKGDDVLGFFNMIDIKSFESAGNKSILDVIYKNNFIPVIELINYKIKQTTSKSTVIPLCYKSVMFFQFSLSSKEKIDMFSSGYQTTKTHFET
jgi:predicted acylesterase/phospholipase RssA